MRVIAGKHRSRKLLMVEDLSTRETKDRVKESIFNMIGPYQVVNDVLDLFAGSGSLGIEAYSRGASNIVFVDQSAKAIDVLKKNTKSLLMSNSSKIHQSDAFVYLSQTNEQFDLIFLDPPYHKVSLEDCLEMIKNQDILRNSGLIVILTDHHTLLENQKGFIIVKQKRITRTNVIFLKWGKTNENSSISR